ncbi:SRPBCC domain-containing protein [Paenibacillus silviterrae]|uniref:SRPBCC domain-containing protein n=1 Tax=Paenibacillus silviterrae TaxID=3242194 RepID=UPI0025429038|nr:SRPBCC domain-containing protein [Paenibacillus chinjuensis]
MSNHTSYPMMSRIEGQTLVLERVFNAPRSLVYQAFSEAEHLKHWWGPRGWGLTVCDLDFRVGGFWHYCMKCLDKNQGDFYGMESWGKSEYKDIVHDERIVQTDWFSDEEGNIAEGMPGSLITTIFEDFEGKTKLISRGEYQSAEELQKVMDMGMLQGVTETWDRLSELLETLK